MKSRLPKLMLKWLMVVMGTLTFTAAAQQSGQSIIFSTPTTGGTRPDAPSLSPGHDDFQPGNMPGAARAPGSLFDFTPPNDILPPSPPPDYLQQRRMKKMLDDRKNWSLMTPEEILGMATTDKTLQPKELDALGREKNQTQLERYLERENQLRAGPTNILQTDRPDASWIFPKDQAGANGLDSSRDNTADRPRSLSEFLTGRRDQGVVQNANWASFGTPLPQASTKPDVGQLAAMERFRQLLNPTPDETVKVSPDSQFFPAPKPADPFLMQSDFLPNPVGASFIPLSSGIARPAGLAPLPTMTTSSSLPVATPVIRLQPPPWLLQGPQPFVMPQRKF